MSNRVIIVVDQKEGFNRPKEIEITNEINKGLTSFTYYVLPTKRYPMIRESIPTYRGDKSTSRLWKSPIQDDNLSKVNEARQK